jgi:hypothetical protein
MNEILTDEVKENFLNELKLGLLAETDIADFITHYLLTQEQEDWLKSIGIRSIYRLTRGGYPSSEAEGINAIFADWNNKLGFTDWDKAEGQYICR